MPATSSSSPSPLGTRPTATSSMSASTVVVALNAQLLRGLDLSPEASAGRVRERA